MDKNPPEVQEVETEVQKFVSGIDGLMVTDQPSYDHANGLLKEAKKQMKMIDDKLGPIKEKTYRAYQDVLSLIKELKGPLESAEKAIKSKIAPYLLEQDRKRREEEEKKRKEIEDKRLKDAEVLAEQGKTEAADKLMEKRVFVPKMELAPKVEKGGTYTVTTWYAEVTDKMLLVKAVAEGKVPISCLEPRMPELNQMASDQHEKLSIPGVVAKSKTDVRTR